MPGNGDRATADGYAWVEDWEGGGFCVAVVKTASARDVLSGMVVDPATPIGSAAETREWAWEQRIPAYATAVEATELEDWVVTVEGNGFLATQDDVICRLSELGPAIALYRNVSAVMRFVYAVDRSVIRAFDPLLYDNRSTWTGEPLAQEEGLAFGMGAPMAAAFACAERLSGLKLTRQFLDSRDSWIAVGHYPSYSVAPGRSWREDKAAMERLVHEEREQGLESFEVRTRWAGRAPSERLRSVGGNVLGIVKLDRDLVDEIERADAKTQRDIARWAARRACSLAGLDQVDWVAAALLSLDLGQPLPPPFDDHRRVWERRERDPRVPYTLVDAPEGGERNRVQQAFALPAVWGASDDDPLRAAFDALFAAVGTCGSDYPELFAEVRATFLST